MFGYRVGLHYILSFTNKWKGIESQQGFREHVENVCQVSIAEVGQQPPLVEFAYNNWYQESLTMSLFEALYGQSCNNPISWSRPMNKVLIGPNMLAEMEQEMHVIKNNPKATRDKKNIYEY